MAASSKILITPKCFDVCHPRKIYFILPLIFQALEEQPTVEAQRENAPTHSTKKAKSWHTPCSLQMGAHTLMKMKHSPMNIQWKIYTAKVGQDNVNIGVVTVEQTFCGLLLINSVTHWVFITLMLRMLSCIRTTLDMYQTALVCSRIILMQFSTCTVRYVWVIDQV